MMTSSPSALMCTSVSIMSAPWSMPAMNAGIVFSGQVSDAPRWAMTRGGTRVRDGSALFGAAGSTVRRGAGPAVGVTRVMGMSGLLHGDCGICPEIRADLRLWGCRVASCDGGQTNRRGQVPDDARVD